MPFSVRIGRRFSVNAADRNVPGLTVFTRMFSGASVRARFFEMLVRADFAAVYDTSPGAWRFVEWAETFTMRAQDAFRRSGSAARMHRTAAMVPMLKCAKKSSSV